MKSGNDARDSQDGEGSTAALFVEAAADEAALERAYPPARDGGPSRATLILAPHGLSARGFVTASADRRAAALETATANLLRRLLGSLTLLLVVGLGLALFVNGPLRLAALAAVALKAGSDLARYRARLRDLEAARELGPDDLEAPAAAAG